MLSSITVKTLHQPRFIPMSGKELDALGWKEIDILLITGDAYVDHPSFGSALTLNMAERIFSLKN